MSDLNTVTTAEAGGPPPAEPNAPLKQDKPRSLAGDAWRDLRRSKIFWFAAVLVVIVLVMAAFPTLFTSADPRACSLSRQFAPASGSAIFGYDYQGCDIFARAVHGARNSIIIGILSTLIAGIIGLIFGLGAGYFGGS